MENVQKQGNKENTLALIKLIVLRVLAYGFLIFNAALCIFIFYLLFVKASEEPSYAKYGLFTLKPSAYFFDNLNRALTDKVLNVGRGTLNSFIVAGLSAVLTTYFSALTAYAIHAYRFKGRNVIATFILLIMTIPSQVSSLGFFKMVYDWGGMNNYLFLILPGIAAPAVYFYMLQYLKATLPLDLVEASRMDGSSEFMTFNRIVLPIMKPALALQLIFTFVASWNNLYIPSLIIDDPKLKTLPIIMAGLRSQSQSNPAPLPEWTVILVAIIPVAAVYLILSRFIIKGVTSGSVKG